MTAKQATGFDYKEADWAEIEASIQKLRKGPVPKAVRRALCTAADKYLFAPRPGEKTELKKKWQEFGTRFARLQHDLSTCVKQSIAAADRDDELMELRLEFINHTCFSVEIGASTARALANAFGDKNNPRLTYQSEVLNVWMRLGGKLQISRNRLQEVRGPLARYFFAVVRPVMGERAPSPETLRDIVDRQKSSRSMTQPITDPKWYSIRGFYDRLCAREDTKLAISLEKARLKLGSDHPVVLSVEKRLYGDGQQERK
jgi:hypothetical protein